MISKTELSLVNFSLLILSLLGSLSSRKLLSPQFCGQTRSISKRLGRETLIAVTMHVAGPAVPAVITSILFTSIAFISVVLRLYTRVFMLKNAGADDYFMVGAMVCSMFVKEMPRERTLLTDLVDRSPPLASVSSCSFVSLN